MTAIIYPQKLPGNIPIRSNEDFFYNKFKKEFDELWTIYYSLKLTTPDINMRELDFVAMHETGLLVVELKNARYKRTKYSWQYYIHREKRWHTVNKPNYKGPIEQARSGLLALGKFLHNHNGPRPGVLSKKSSYLTIFLKNKRKDFDLSPEEKRHCLFEEDFENKSLYELVCEHILDVRLDHLDLDELNEIHNIICNHLNLVESFENKTTKHSKSLLALTKEQFQVLTGLADGRGMLVAGEAGSGKTLVALEAARRASMRKQRVLLVCHSSNLAKHLQMMCQNLENVQVITMASLCFEIIQSAEPEFNAARHKRSARFGKSHTKVALKKMLREKALEHVEQWSKQHQYDLLIIDEAQDLLTVSELLIFDSLLIGGFKKGNWLVVYDPVQGLYGEISKGLEFLQKNLPDIQALRFNIRTPKKIFAYASYLRNLDDQAQINDLADIQFVEYKNQKDGLRKLEFAINYAVNDLGLRLEDVVILSPNNKKNTDILQTKWSIGPYKIKLLKFGKASAGFVGFSKITRFKGLEIPFVILTGINDFNAPEMKNSIFIALTRATHAAAIFFRRGIKIPGI